MISLTAAIVFIVVILPVFACAMGIAMAPSFDAGKATWYASIADAPDHKLFLAHVERWKKSQITTIDIPSCVVKGESSTLPRAIGDTVTYYDNMFDARDQKPATTLTGIPAIIAPSYQGEGVKVMAPRIIGDARDVKGRFMPRYKS
jgi:hypothetical protein